MGVRHSTVVVVPDDGSSPVGTNEWNALHVDEDGNPINVREKLTANRNYYVATSGLDTNNGSVGSPWLTLQHAVNHIASTIDPAGFVVYINVGAGTFAGCSVPIYQGTIVISGSGSANTTLTKAIGTFHIIGSDAYQIVVNGVTLSDTGILYTFELYLGSVIIGDFATTSDIVFDNSSGSTAAVGVYGPTIVYIGIGNFEVKGSWNALFDIQSSGIVQDFGTWTFTGTPSFATSCCFVVADGTYQGNGAAFSGAATGKRFNIIDGTITTPGGTGGLNFLPGSTPGTATAGFYDNIVFGQLAGTSYAVASLPSAGIGVGARAFATDSNATLVAGLGNIVVGGGANGVPVYSDGTNWRIG